MAMRKKRGSKKRSTRVSTRSKRQKGGKKKKKLFNQVGGVWENSENGYQNVSFNNWAKQLMLIYNPEDETIGLIKNASLYDNDNDIASRTGELIQDVVIDINNEYQVKYFKDIGDCVEYAIEEMGIDINLDGEEEEEEGSRRSRKGKKSSKRRRRRRDEEEEELEDEEFEDPDEELD